MSGELRMICPVCDHTSNRLFEGWEAVRGWASEPINCQVCGAGIVVRVELRIRAGEREYENAR